MQASDLELVQWQEALQNIILRKENKTNSNLLQWVKSGNRIPHNTCSAEKRIDVYLDAYVLRLLEALRTNYPVIHQLIGDDYFDVMGCRYLAAFPPEHASIRWFGDHLSDFLKKETPYLNVPSLAELADFEWALRHTVDAADIERVTPEHLQSLPPEKWGDLAFSLHPSLTILKLDWNAPHIWKAMTEEISSDSVAKDIPEPARQASYWLVYRQPDLASGWRSATPLEVAALDSIFHGLTFADLCEELCNLVDDVDSVPLTAATFLRSWVEQGLLALRPLGQPESRYDFLAFT